MSFRSAAASSVTTATTAAAAAAAAAANKTRTRSSSTPSVTTKNHQKKKTNTTTRNNTPPSRRSVFMAGSASAAIRPLLRLAGSGAAAAAGSGSINLVARASSGGSGATSEIAKVLIDPKYPDEFPFGANEMARYDESSDLIFYSQPRFVKHIDDDAIGALTKYYAKVFPPSGSEDVALLDVCSSWISHYPKDYKAGRISGLGMNEDELKKNPILDDYNVRDLNENPTLPYPDNTFDVVRKKGRKKGARALITSTFITYIIVLQYYHHCNFTSPRAHAAHARCYGVVVITGCFFFLF